MAPDPTPTTTPPQPEIDASRVIPIVVGSSLRAEREDRPLAYQLADRLAGPAVAMGLEPVVCTDVWYLNDATLAERAAVSLGGPDVNALTAHLASRVPSAYVIDGVLMVQFDVEARRGHACCWGVNAEATAQAVIAFMDRHAEAFLAGHGVPLL
ncbi:MAG: hypothetical protein ACI89L_001114 [Phycisphaerales bacterium]|jgi:hypothetical protein